MFLVNGLKASSIRTFFPWSGTWVVEADIEGTAVPSGAATVQVGNNPILSGTIDPASTGLFGQFVSARILGGGGGWHRPVSARHFHNDAGVTSAAVISATAAEVGERVTVPTPARLGVDFVRTAGPASRVLAGLDWYVDAAGTTIVAPRTPADFLGDDIEVLEYSPSDGRLRFASDALVAPGTQIKDARFGVLTLRDVQQTFNADGARGFAWCSAATAGTSPGGKLVTLLASLVKETAKAGALRPYRYRVVSQGVDGRMTLQAVSRTAGAPDAIAISPWYGLPGVAAKVVPGTECVVVFLDGDFAQPVIVAFHGKTTEIAIGDAPQPVALAPAVVDALSTLKAAIKSAVPLANDGGAQFKTQLMAALESWPPDVAAKKLKTD